jgi:SAM-dependent methyltransferase
MIEIRHPDMLDSHATQAAYDEIYSGRGILRRDSFFLAFLSHLPLEPGKQLIDISCGQGQLVKLAQGKGVNSLGVDFSKVSVKYGKTLDPNADWLVSDGESLGLQSACADYVTHIGSLEHYQDIEAGIREIARVLKPSGLAVVMLPNTFSFFGNFLYLIKHGDVFDDGQPLQRYNTRVGWKTLLENNGLLVKTVHKHEPSVPRTWPDFLWLMLHPIKLTKLFLCLLLPLNLTNTFIFLCESKHTVDDNH